MERKLREVEELPAQTSSRVLQLGDDGYVQLDLLDEAEDETLIAPDDDDQTPGRDLEP